MSTETILFINCFALMGLLVMQSFINHRLLRTARKLAEHTETMANHVLQLADLAKRNNEMALQLAQERQMLNEHAGFWFTEWLKMAGR